MASKGNFTHTSPEMLNLESEILKSGNRLKPTYKINDSSFFCGASRSLEDAEEIRMVEKFQVQRSSLKKFFRFFCMGKLCTAEPYDRKLKRKSSFIIDKSSNKIFKAYAYILDTEFDIIYIKGFELMGSEQNSGQSILVLEYGSNDIYKVSCDLEPLIAFEHGEKIFINPFLINQSK